jgi:hypothetical protein
MKWVSPRYNPLSYCRIGSPIASSERNKPLRQQRSHGHRAPLAAAAGALLTLGDARLRLLEVTIRLPGRDGTVLRQLLDGVGQLLEFA